MSLDRGGESIPLFYEGAINFHPVINECAVAVHSESRIPIV